LPKEKDIRPETVLLLVSDPLPEQSSITPGMFCVSARPDKCFHLRAAISVIFRQRMNTQNRLSYLFASVDLKREHVNVIVIQSDKTGSRDLMEQLAPRCKSLKRHETVSWAP
jgi:hypothetical protein